MRLLGTSPACFCRNCRPSLAEHDQHDCAVEAAKQVLHQAALACVGVVPTGPCLSYACRPDSTALSGVDLWLQPGKMTALVGLSGSGKSTLVSLLQRLYDPTGAWCTALPLWWLCWVAAVTQKRCAWRPGTVTSLSMLRPACVSVCLCLPLRLLLWRVQTGKS